MPKNIKQTFQELLALADIKINGNRPGDIQVHNPRLYSRVLAQGSMGLGESYMDGWWDCDQLDEFFNKILKAKLNKKVVSPGLIFNAIKSKIMNMQTKSRSKQVAKQHYDLCNEFFEQMLDKRMQYTCAYWESAKTLDKAQENKLHLICKKLQLKPGQTVLELGCGWGGLAKFIAEKYKCHVTAYNISAEQVRYAQRICKGLPVKIIQSDYRHAKGKYDKIVSIGLCEHVGYKNYKTLMKVAHRRLKKNGLFLLHTIGRNTSAISVDPWFGKYIFPNSVIPSSKQITAAAEGLFTLEDWHSFGPDYDKTIMAWHKNFEKNWHKFESKGQRFYRMWRYYLSASAGAFRARSNQLWQIVFSKEGVLGGYKSVR